MEVSTESPPAIAHAEQPFPRWSEMTRVSSLLFPVRLRYRYATYRCDVPWKPYRRIRCLR